MTKARPPKHATPNYAWRLREALTSQRFARIFMVSSVVVLVVTTVFWSALSALVVRANADQLIDAYLFEDLRTFQGAAFPGQHTFLLKWPLFAAMAALGNTPLVLGLTTVFLALATVGALGYLMYRIERRPLVFGGLCLALASVLLMVPAEPYAGALLPSNFAMTTTRNLEYVVLLASMYLVLTASRWLSWRVFAGLLLATLLIASDKLFIAQIVGGAAATILFYFWKRRSSRQSFVLAGRWLGVGISASLAATVLLVMINWLGLTHIVSETSASPFALVGSAEQLAQGALFALGAALTNFGANPVHDVVVVRELPGALVHSLASLSIVAYAINLLLFAAGIWALAATLRNKAQDTWSRMTVLLAGATLAALGVFVTTDHYYPVDTRYVAIELFALFAALASYLRTKQFEFRRGVVLVSLLLAVLPVGGWSAWQDYQNGQSAYEVRNAITKQVAAALDRLHIGRLVGNYWYITPVKSATKSATTIVPVEPCTAPRGILNSAAWIEPAQLPKPAVYLAVQDGTLPRAYGGCTLSEIVGHYGTPTGQLRLPGLPHVRLLVYNQGMPSPLDTSRQRPFIAKPVQLPALRPLNAGKICATGTVLNVVAHQDDDLLFLSPDLLRMVDERRCMRTVYVTAGDAGVDLDYWYNRERGAMAAYARMYNVENSWRQSYQTVLGKRVSVQTLEQVPQLSLVFMRLPDAGLAGAGYSLTNFESLSRLFQGSIDTIHSIDKQTNYSRQQLVDVVATIMQFDHPGVVMTHDNLPENAGDDHADHRAVGDLANAAAAAYRGELLLRSYMGYSGKYRAMNLSAEDVERKMAAFLAYAAKDPAVCQTDVECSQAYTYGRYISRQYVVENIIYKSDIQPL